MPLEGVMSQGWATARLDDLITDLNTLPHIDLILGNLLRVKGEELGLQVW